MDYDCINMGTYNYEFSNVELEKDLSGIPHVEFDMAPYADRYRLENSLKELGYEKFLQIIESSRNYGNTWL